MRLFPASSIQLSAWLFALGTVLAGSPFGAGAEPTAAEMLEQLERGDVDQRIEAARWLGLHRVEQARTPFLQLMTAPRIDPRLASTVRLMYDLVRNPRLLRYETSEEVLAHLESDDPRARADAARHTAYFDLQAAIPRLGRRLGDPDPLVRQETLVALRLMGDRSQRKAVLVLLEDPEGAVRLRAFEYLFALDDPALMDRLVTVAGDPSRWIAPTAARQLAGSDRADSAVAALLTRAAECLDHARTARYLTALGRFASPTEWPPISQERLEPFLEHENERVRIGAAALVAPLDPSAARRTLERALASDDAENRLEATRALAEVEGPAEPSTVARLLADEDPEVRRAAVTLAAALAPRQRRRAYLEVLERPDEPDEVLSLVLASFPEVGAEEDAELLMRHAREGGSGFLRMNAVTALARLERRTGTRLGDLWYREVLGGGTEDEVIKRTVLTALQLTGDETYLPLLAAELKACPPESKAYAEALAKTISILVGRRLHGEAFGLEASP